jgi:acyl-coenzyme A thioesterase PaaI-like protein
MPTAGTPAAKAAITITITAMDTHATTIETLSESHRDCFACGVRNHIGLNLHFEIGSDGIATAFWQPSSAYQSYANRLHGGVIATMLDSAMLHALFAKGIAGVTAELTIRYLQAVDLVEPLQITASIEMERRGIYLCRADIHQNGTRAVRATAKFMAMPSIT